MNENCLQIDLKEVNKSVKLIITIPSPTATAESTFSALGRINTYCKSNQRQERLHLLSSLSIKTALLENVKRLTFYNELIQKSYRRT